MLRKYLRVLLIASSASLAGTALFGLARPQMAQGKSAAAPVAMVPNGASSLEETYQDWRVICHQSSKARQCAVGQMQADAKSGQHILSIEMSSQGNKVAAVLVLPFGLDLAKGLVLQIDTQPPLAAMGFRTCLPAGCIVQTAFEDRVVTAFRHGKILKLHALDTNGAPLDLSAPLLGLPQAMDRLKAIMAAPLTPSPP